MTGRWASSQRRSQLPRNWPTLRAQVKRRARGKCEATVHEPDCNGIGTDCDHIKDPDDHSLDNLQWLSSPCHKAKTQAEAGRARGVIGRLRPQPRHPGMA